MGLGDVLGPSDTTEHYLVGGLQLALVGIGGYGLLVFEVGVVVPAVVALAITSLPAVLRRGYNYSMDTGLVLWISVAVFLHTIGALGLYARYQCYDEVTYTVSASLMAALGYAAFRSLELHTDEVDVPTSFRDLFVVVFVLAAAVASEIMEFALGGFVTVYGIDDIVTDVIANAVGAVTVAVVGAGPVDGLVGFFWDRLGSEDA